MIRHSDFERTIHYASKALEHMRANQAPAYPRNYELWYSFVAGINRSLNRALNDAITRYGQVPESVLQELYDEFLSPDRFADRIDGVSTELMKELNQALAAIDDSKNTTKSYSDSLKGAAEELASESESAPDRLRTVIASLLHATKEMEHRSVHLESQLDETRKQIHVLHENLEAVRTETITDALTGIANRKHFDHAIKSAVRCAEETEEPMCLIIGDIDHFKSFNDTYGHQTGDQVLRLVAHAIKANVKGRDTAARYGGEEFAIILPQTDLADATTVGEHIRKSIMAKELVKKSTGESLGTITMSFGIAAYRPGETVETLIGRADTSLYTAKRAGRNQVRSEVDRETDPVEDVA